MIAWTPPVTVPTNASGAPTLVSAAGRTALVVPDVTGGTAAAAAPVVREIGFPGRRLIAARGFTMLTGLATAAGSRIAVAGVQYRGRRMRGAVLAGKPGARLKRIATLPGALSKPVPQSTAPGPSVGFFPAGNEPDPALVVGVAIPVAIAGNARGDIAVLFRRRRSGSLTYRVELWVKRGKRSRVTTLEGVVPSLGAAAVALNARGDALAAWKADGAVHARMVTPTSVSALSRLGTTKRAGPVRAQLPARGRGVVAWGSQTAGDGHGGPFRAYAATQRKRGFGKRTVLGAAPYDETYGFAAGVLLAPLPGGATALAWSGGTMTATVQTATIAAGALTPVPDAVPGRLEALASAPDGSTAVVASTARRSVTVRAAGAPAFETPTDLGPTTGILPSLAFDGSSHPLVAWRNFRTPINVSTGG